ncbi:MAG: response regulator [Blastocatellia bacterium]|nr:response regulator [Blastocatellia bacterium]MCS7156192.1 response regulator [Blastocatellia bacterium]MCX7751458.1 response regulator [Blastocatellia bacterium]MDW8169171.1 response regulator [Acidobacteriota bacterium]MDW8256032.1 response regulator [Acidobacteriota bacterium]
MARILLIDDEPNVRLLYATVLNENGHQVREASSGNEAMRCLEQEPVDLVVLDIKLGKENGLELLQEIVHRHPRVPVILLTAYTSFQDDYTCWLATRYIVKETDVTTFLREVERVLNATRLTAS